MYLKSYNILKNAIEASYFVPITHFQQLVDVFKILNMCKKYFIIFYLYTVVGK